MELTDWDIEYLGRMYTGNNNAGYLVETKTGKRGRTRHSDPEYNGKTLVYLDSGEKLACTTKTLKVIGFID